MTFWKLLLNFYNIEFKEPKAMCLFMEGSKMLNNSI